MNTFDLMKRDPRHHGFGYIGHSERDAGTDRMLMDAAEFLGLDYETLFLWANSRPARHFMDFHAGSFKTDLFIAEIREVLPELRAEVSRD